MIYQMCRLKTWWTPTVRQTWVASALLINKFGQGMVLGTGSAMITTLRAPDSDIKIDIDMMSWLVSSLALATLSGFLIVSVLMNKFGRKITYCIKVIPGMVGLLLLGFGSNVIIFLVGRILCGVSGGSTAILGAMIIGELISPSHRGMFLNLNTAFLNFGSLFSHVLTHYVHWQTASLACIIPFIVTIAIALTWPESPSWLAEKKNIKESIESFYWLRGKTKESIKEIEEIVKLHQVEREKKSCTETIINFLEKFKKRNFVKPCIISFLMAILMECCGRHVFPSYGTIIVNGMITNNVNSFFCTVSIDVLITSSTFLSSYLIKIIKLRILLFTTGIVSVVLLSLACLNYYLVISSVISDSFSWMPITLLSFFFISVNLSCSSVPHTIVGEIFPLEHRAAGTFITGMFVGTAFTVTLKIAPYLFVSFGIHGALLFLASGLAITLLALYFILPETKNKTLIEIEYFFVHGKYREDAFEIDDTEVEMKLLKIVQIVPDDKN